MPKSIDLTGQRFGKLVVIKQAESAIMKNGYPLRKWLCKCDCGNDVVVRVADLKNGNTKSCGCYQREVARKIKTKHNGCEERMYSIWCNMKTRCLNPNVPAYKDYGGRGITICQEWTDSYTAFRDWCLDNGYKDTLTIERIDVNRGYEPDNCTFIGKEKQPLNARSNHLVTYKGKTKTLTEWSRELHFGRGNFRSKRGKFATDEDTINHILSSHRNQKIKNKGVISYGNKE